MFEPKTYASRRARLAERLGGGLVLVPGNRLSPMNYADNSFDFRQDGTFRYYFGLNLPDFWATIDADTGESILYGHEPTLDEVVWMGPQPALAELADLAGVDSTGDSGDLATRIGDAAAAGRPLLFLPQYRPENQRRLSELTGIPVGELDLRASRPLMEAVIEQRLVKEPAEIVEMERAGEIAHTMHTFAMRAVRPGLHEAEVAGRVRGLALAAKGDISFPIIFSVRGEVLHNHTWSNVMGAGDLVVHDSGAVTNTGYCSDITRTFPVSGTYDPRQKDVYEAVLQAQLDAIDAMAPGVPFVDVHLTAARTLAGALVDIGLLAGSPDDIVEAGAHALFFPHGLGHMIGLDVHDGEAISEEITGYGTEAVRSEQFGLSALRLARPLRPGWVVTVEPGAYFIPPLIRKWRQDNRHAGFINYDRLDDWLDFGGVRIEDDVLVTEEGTRILGPAIPKTVDDVERTMAETAELGL